MKLQQSHYSLMLAGLLVIAIAGTFITSEQSPSQHVAGNQTELPLYLKEASGLAVVDSLLLIHDDEVGDFYTIDPVSKDIRHVLSLGSPAIERDFEGVALNSDTLFVVTSEGELFHVTGFDPDAEAVTVEAQSWDTGLGSQCEVEGLAYLENRLLIPCKTPLTDEHGGGLVIFWFNPATGEDGVELTISTGAMPGIDLVQPTAIDVTDDAYFVVSINSLFKIDRGSLAVQVFTLSAEMHNQPEGLAILDDGRIALVEDSRRGISRLTIYRSLEELVEAL